MIKFFLAMLVVALCIGNTQVAIAGLSVLTPEGSEAAVQASSITADDTAALPVHVTSASLDEQRDDTITKYIHKPGGHITAGVDPPTDFESGNTADVGSGGPFILLGANNDDAQEVVSKDTEKKESVGFVASIVKSLTEEAHVTIAYGIVQWKMDIRRSSDGATATMIQRDNSAIFLSYGSKPSFFKDSNFGYTFSVNYVHFDMRNQDTSSDHFTNIGTEMEGYLLYAVPTLYYQWGEHRFKGTFVRLGIGMGVGAASYSGTAQLSTGEVIYTQNRSIKPRLALSNFLEARWHHIGISFSYASPRIYGDGYDIRASGVTANVGYTYYF